MHISTLVSFAAVLITANAASLEAFDGCWYDGFNYKKGDIIVIPKCLGQMTCLGNNVLSDITPATNCDDKREADGQTGCLYDGTVYAKGDIIVIPKCLGQMTCLGNNVLSDITPATNCDAKRETDGQTGCLYDGTVYAKGDIIVIPQCLAGCLYDGTVYAKGDIIVIPKCLGQMTCLGNNVLSDITPATNCDAKREADGQTGCLYDGTVYAKGDIIVIPKCLGQMTCLGNNVLSDITPATNCDAKREADGQTGCLYDGTVYAKGDIIVIPKCLGQMTCLGNNVLSDITPATNCDAKREADGQTGCLYDGTVYAKGDIIVIPKCLGQMTCLGNNVLSDITPATNCDAKREADGQTGCLYDGTVYAKGDIIVIPKCLGQMTCLGNNVLSDITPATNCDAKRDADGQTGCLYDGTVYAKGDIIVIPKCLGQMTCLGNNVLSDITPATNCDAKREADGQTGCLFDGTVYAKGDIIVIPKCLGQMTCLGNNLYSDITPAQNCVEKREVDGQTGCLFDGKVYAAGEEIIIPKCLAKMTCLGFNNYGNIEQLYGICP